MALNKLTDDITLIDYEITDDPRFQDEEQGITPWLSDQLEDLHYEINDKNNKTAIPKLKELILQFPKAAILKNYLSVAYNAKGLQEKCSEINKQILAEHPNYLYGKLNLAINYLAKKDFKKVEELLGKEMEIHLLLPDRKTFHKEEIRSFLSFAVRYFIEKDDIEAAETRLQMLLDLDPDHPDTEAVYNQMMSFRLVKGHERWLREWEEAIEVVTDKYPPMTNEKNPPIFNHPIIAELYKYDYEINQSIIREILALPRETLVADLENLLKDSVNRYHYFLDEADEDTSFYFPTHALLLLAELKSESSLPVILDVLSYDVDFISLWFEGFVTEDLWLIYYKLADNNLDVLKNFLLAPGIETYVKGEVPTAFVQLFFHEKISREELSVLFQTIYEGFLNADIDNNLIDSTMLGFMVCETINGGLKELLPIIKQLFDKGYISEGICGGYYEVAKDMGSSPKYKKKKEIFTIFQYYDEVIEAWFKHEERTKLLRKNPVISNNEKSFIPPPPSTVQPFPLVSNKVGRNDPCPCGSGKKYKKCCME